MRIGVIGAGALGLYYGALLQKAGHDVHFLMRRDFAASKKQGLRIYSPHGDFHLDQVNSYLNSEEIGIVDLVLIGLKTYANDLLNAMTRPLVGPKTVILTLQNGLGNEETLSKEFDHHQIVGGVAFLCCNRGEPGTVYHLDQGPIRIALYDEGSSFDLIKLAKTFIQAGIPCEACNDLQRIRWEKLVWNIPFNGLCALTQLPTDQLMKHAETEQLVSDIMQEVIEAANRQGLSNPINGPELIHRMLEATRSMGDYRPSMLIDRQENAPLELEAIYHIPLARAVHAQRPMTRVDMLYALLLATEKS